MAKLGRDVLAPGAQVGPLFERFAHDVVLAVAAGLRLARAVPHRLRAPALGPDRSLQTSRDEALTDPLTGLANRRALTRRLECDLPDASDERPLVLALFDLDGFELSSHVDGVAELAEAIARRLALDEEQVEHIRHAGELHGVGKMAKYPDRLAGRAIPLGSRGVAVADAFDAMTADRSNSRPRTPAHRRSSASAGGQFDPEVVEAFGAVWAERETRVAS